MGYQDRQQIASTGTFVNYSRYAPLTLPVHDFTDVLDHLPDYPSYVSTYNQTDIVRYRYPSDWQYVVSDNAKLWKLVYDLALATYRLLLFVPTPLECCYVDECVCPPMPMSQPVLSSRLQLTSVPSQPFGYVAYDRLCFYFTFHLTQSRRMYISIWFMQRTKENNFVLHAYSYRIHCDWALATFVGLVECFGELASEE